MGDGDDEMENEHALAFIQPNIYICCQLLTIEALCFREIELLQNA